jgi:nucleotide-binding universal stress UspA family protein
VAKAGIMFRKILIAVDEGDAAGFAIQTAGLLADALGASVAFVHVIEACEPIVGELGMTVAELRTGVRADALQLLKERALQMPGSTRPEFIVREGDPATEILAAATDYEADLLVIGSAPHGRLAELFMVGTAEKIIHHAACPVMVVRKPPPDASSPQFRYTVVSRPDTMSGTSSS